MDQPGGDETSTTKEQRYDRFSSSKGRTKLVEFEKTRTESLGDDTEYGEETQSTLEIRERSSYLQIPFGFQSRGSYKHASKNCEIVGGSTLNSYLTQNYVISTNQCANPTTRRKPAAC